MFSERGVYVRKLILGITWQALGFLGAVIILCFAASHQWDYNGITGILGSLLGLQLLLPLIACLLLFILGLLLCLKSIRDK